MEVCLEAGIPSEVVAGEWRPVNIDRAEEALAAVAEELGYKGTWPYLIACRDNPAEVERRLKAL